MNQGDKITYFLTESEKQLSVSCGLDSINTLPGHIIRINLDGSINARIMSDYNNDFIKRGLIQGSLEGQYQLV